MLLLFAALMIMWFTGISDQLPAEVMIATLLFMPGINLLTWSQAQKEGPWGIVILYGSSLSLSLALQQNQVVKWAADRILSRIGMPAPLPLDIIRPKTWRGLEFGYWWSSPL